MSTISAPRTLGKIPKSVGDRLGCRASGVGELGAPPRLRSDVALQLGHASWVDGTQTRPFLPTSRVTCAEACANAAPFKAVRVLDAGSGLKPARHVATT